MDPRSSCTSTRWRLAVVLRAWFVALLAFPALAFGASPPAQVGEPTAEIGQEAVVRAAAPLPNADGKPVDEVAAAEAEQEEDTSKRHGDEEAAAPIEHGVVLAALRAFECTAPELVVQCTPQREHRLHNRGPPANC